MVRRTKKEDFRGSLTAARATVTLDTSGLEKIRDRFKFMEKTTLTIGVQGSEGQQKYKRTGANLASVAMYNEFGVPSSSFPPRWSHPGIPARSFLRSSMFENRDKIQKTLGRALGKTLGAGGFDLGGKGDPITELGLAGAVLVGMVRDKIRTSGLWAVPNASSTAFKKGFDFPLIETLKLRDSITWAVRIGGQITAKDRAF